MAEQVDAEDLKCLGVVVFIATSLQTSVLERIKTYGTKPDLQNI
jgi:hypothetical protein